MSFEKDKQIDNSEYLYRSFHYDEWNFEQNRPSTGVFTSSNSLSVDRDGERQEDDIIEGFRQRQNYEKCGLVKQTAEYYRKCETEPIPDPKEYNIFHALVNGKDMIGTRRSHAKKLVKDNKLVAMAET